MKFNGNIDLGNVGKVVGSAAPSAAGDLVNKAYADALKAGMDWKDSVRAATTGNISLAAPGATIDGVSLTAGDRVLLLAQTAPAENGIWIWNGSAVAMTRATDADANAEVTSGLTAVVTEGTANGDSVWVLTTNDPIVVGTTGLSFSQIGTIVNVGTGLSKAGNTISLVVPVTVALGGTGATTAAGARTNLGVPGFFAQNFGDGSATSFAITHGLGTKDVVVVVYLNSTGAEEEVDVVRNSTSQVTLSGWTVAPAAAAYRVVVMGM